MSRLDTEWLSFPISPEERNAKEAAIRAHETQVAMTKPFLLSFVCRNELFGTRMMKNILANDSEPREFVENPIADSFPRARLGEGDIQSVRAMDDRSTLHVALQMRENASPRVRYQVHLRGIGRRGETEPTSLLIRTNDSETLKRQGIRVSFEGKRVQFEIPASLLRRNEWGGCCFLAVSVETSLAGVEIDRTGVHLVSWGGIM
jgi:hypothetical protein